MHSASKQGVRRSLAGIAFLAASTAAAAGDWPQFRGPQRDGVSSEQGLAREWPAEGPKALWRAQLGPGFSGISVVAGRAYTMFGVEADEFAACFDAATGQEIWRVRTDSQYKDSFGDGPRSTPTVDGERVFVLGARGKLHALATASGERVWLRDFVAEFGSTVPRWGFSTSPLVEGDLLLVEVGGADGSGIVAFDKRTGKEAWRSGSDQAAYAAPIAVTIGSSRQAVFFTSRHLVGLAPGDGALLWKQPWTTSYDVNASTPVFIPPDKLFVSSGYDVGAALYRVTGSGVEQLWRNREMKNKFSSSVLRDRHLYGFDEGTLKCISAESGETKWRARGFGHGSLILADGHLLVLGDEGTLAMIEATAGEYLEKARAKIFSGKTWTVPTLADGKLYLRNEKELLSLGVAR